MNIILRLFFLLSLLASYSVFAQDQNQDQDQVQEQALEEIEIVGSRTLLNLQQAIKQAEVRIYDVFNELNDEIKYDIHCEMEAPIGSLLKAQVCRPNFVRDATRQDAQATLQGRYYQSATALIQYHNRRLEEKMTELVEESPELFDAVRVHYDLQLELSEKSDDFFD